MAKDKDKSRSFDLDKGKKRSFDLDKGTKHSFDLSKEDGVIEDGISDGTRPGDEPQPYTPGPGNTGSGKTKWIVAAIIIVVIAIAVWLMFGRGASGTEDIPTTEQISNDNAETGNSSAVNNDAGTQPENSSDTAVSSETPAPDGNVAPQQGEQAVTPTTDKATTPSAAESAPTVGNGQPTQNNDTPQLGQTIDEQAQQVIRGDFGNGEERKQKLGGNYAAIQKRVNEMYKEGLVK